jgi:shikimate dehydrogenase
LIVKGDTELVGVVGYPIRYTLSPALHNAAFSRMGMNWIYLPLRVPPGDLEAAMDGLRALGFKGYNVTIPYKMEAVRFVDGLRGDAELLEAVNTVLIEDGHSYGHNTDMDGFRAFMREAGMEAAGSTVLLIGAGGASRAVAMALAAEGAARIYIMNRTAEKTRALADLLKRATSATEISVRTFDLEGSRVMGECDIVVNCTPLTGSKGSGLPLDYRDFSGRKWAIDLKYASGGTAFLDEASSRGARTADGEGMLVHQAAASFKLWTGKPPPLLEMREAYHAALKGR